MEVGPNFELGRYRLIRRLGSGGMGHVWLAQDILLERDVAVKVISSAIGIDAQSRERFRREALVLARLAHPNVVTVYDIGVFDSGSGDPFPFLVMERLHGHSLENELSAGALAPARVLQIMEQVARALAAAHALGVVHRDLKPSNIHVSADGHVTVLDFGLARMLEDAGGGHLESLTTTGMVVGSCFYMSPEQATGEHATLASDIFSFGVILYEALSGSKPFEGGTPILTLRAVAEARHTPLADVVSSIDPALAAVTERCLARDPQNRYRDGAALLDDVVRVLGQLPPSSGVATRSLQRHSVEALRRRKLRLWSRRLVAITVIAAAAAVAGLIFGRTGFEPRRQHPGAWRVVSLLELSGWVRGPAWNPAGTLIAVEHNQGSEAEILVVRPDGSDRVSVMTAQNGTILSRPRFSPDGRRLSFTIIRDNGQAIAIVPATGGAPLVELESADHGSWIDDTHLAFVRQGESGSSLWVSDLTDGTEKLLLEARDGQSWWGATPRPGGGLAITGGPSDINTRVFVLATGARTPAPWTDAPEPISSLSWSPEGTALLAVADRQLVVLESDARRRILPAIVQLDGADLSPDGERIAAVRNDRRTDLVAFNPVTGDSQCLLCGLAGLGWGSVGPDGTLAFRRQSGPDRSLFVRPPNGGDRRVVPPTDDASCPVFSPDGSRIAYLSAEGANGTELRVVALAGGEPVTIAEKVERSEFPSWSPDGRFLTFAAGTPVRVLKASSAGGPAEVLTPNGGDYPRWSPDGSWIAYVVWTEASDPNQGVWVVPAVGGEPLQIGDTPTQLGWSPDGQRLWQVRRDAEGLSLWAAPTGTWRWRRVRAVALGTPPSPHSEHLPFTVDPGSGRLVFNRRSVAGELILFSGIDPTRW